MKVGNYYVDCIDDVGENKGGYYCMVYLDDEMNYEIDSFCITPHELNLNDNVEYWITEHFKTMYDGNSLTYILDIELEDDDTDNGGIAFVGETVRDFLDYCLEDSAEAGEDLSPHNIDELNEMLIQCGIKPITVKKGV